MLQPHPAPRYANPISFSFLVWMVVFAILLASGGVTYSVLKYNQVSVRTEIKQLRLEIAMHSMNASQYRAEANSQTNYWEMLQRLEDDGSQLRPIELSQIEEVHRFADRDSVAATATAAR